MRKLEPAREHLTILIVGESGAGKTSLAATAPKPIILNRDNGLSSLYYKRYDENLRIEDIESTADFDASLANLRGDGRKDWTGFQSVVIDDLSEMQMLMMDEILRAMHERDPRRQMDDPSKREYGLVGTRFRRYIRAIKRLPMHRVMVSAMTYDSDAEKFKPALVGAMRTQIPHFCDLVGFLRTGKDEKRYLYFRSSRKWFAKSRLWWLPTKIEIALDSDGMPKPNLEQIIDMVNAGPTTKAQPKKRTSTRKVQNG